SSQLLRPIHEGAQRSRMLRLAEHIFGSLSRRYGNALHFSLQRRWLSAGCAVLVCLSLPLLYQLPQRELAPPEDQAAVLAAIKSPQHVSLDYAERFAMELHHIMQAIPEGVGTWIINGTEGPAASFGGANLSDWDLRTRKEPEIVAELQGAVADIAGSSIFVFQNAPLPGGSGGLPVQLVLRSAQDHQVLFEAMEGLKQRARESDLSPVQDSDLDHDSAVGHFTGE